VYSNDIYERPLVILWINALDSGLTWRKFESGKIILIEGKLLPSGQRDNTWTLFVLSSFMGTTLFICPQRNFRQGHLVHHQEPISISLKSILIGYDKNPIIHKDLFPISSLKINTINHIPMPTSPQILQIFFNSILFKMEQFAKRRPIFC